MSMRSCTCSATFRVALLAPLQSSMPFTTPSLQRAKQLLVTRLTLDVRRLHPEDLPQPVVPDGRDAEHALTHYPVSYPNLLLAGVDEQLEVKCSR